jgi:hypothetical protein
VPPVADNDSSSKNLKPASSRPDKAPVNTAAPQRASESADTASAALPKDRNARVRELAARKMAEAKGGKAKALSAGAGLNTSELVDDALARGFATFVKWGKTNLRLIEYCAIVAVLGFVAFIIYDWQASKRL